MNDLTIIIVSWNCKVYLADCLRSIYADGSSISRAVMVVDNNSNDGTLEMLREDFPRVDLISNAENRGFAAANNQGLKASRSRFVLLLNPDTVVRPGAFDAMVKFMDDHVDAWAIGPKILNGDGSRQHSGVRFPNNWNILVETLFLDRLFPHTKLFGRHKELYKDPERSHEVDYLQGSCLMVRSDAVARVGSLDERFFMYFEETDWCYRMKKAGGTIRYCPSATIVHFGGNEIGHFDERRLVHYHTSLLRFYHKHCSLGRTTALRLVLFLRSLIRIVLWCATWILKPGLRGSAVSSVRGYLRAITIVLTTGVE